MRSVLLLSSVCAALAGSGCGSSLRMVYQSSVYYERCYSADFDARIRGSEKEACWTAWLEHYTPGQPSHRIDYAMGRLEAIARGEALPTLPGMPEASLATSSSTVTFSASDLEVPPGDVEPGAMPTDGTGLAPSDAASGGPPRLTAVPTRDTSAPATAPAVADTTGSGAPRTREVAPPPVSAACAPVCTPPWDACIARCNGRAAGCLDACRINFRHCAAACF